VEASLKKAGEDLEMQLRQPSKRKSDFFTVKFLISILGLNFVFSLAQRNFLVFFRVPKSKSAGYEFIENSCHWFFGWIAGAYVFFQVQTRQNNAGQQRSRQLKIIIPHLLSVFSRLFLFCCSRGKC